jgi:hypothetical protein
MSPETPYFGPAYDYEIDPEFRPSYLNLERDVPSLPVEPGIVVRPVLGNRMNISFIYFEPYPRVWLVGATGNLLRGRSPSVLGCSPSPRPWTHIPLT